MSYTDAEEWFTAKADTRDLVDGIGGEMDEGIVETVAILRLMGVNTISSCAGHRGRVTNAPYVMFAAEEARKLESRYRALKDYRLPEYQHLFETARELNLRERLKLLPYLTEFYAHRETPYTHRLIIQEFGAQGGYLHCQGAGMAHIAGRQEQAAILARNQAEMAAFTNFLCRRYFSDVRLASSAA